MSKFTIVPKQPLSVHFVSRMKSLLEMALRRISFNLRVRNIHVLHHLKDKAVLEPRVSPAFAITYFCNHRNIRFENTSKYVDTLTLFSKNLNQRSLTPR